MDGVPPTWERDEGTPYWFGGPVPRCATTTRDPSTGQRDLDTLRAIAAYRGRRDGKDIDFGVYAQVVRPGRVRVGDAVEPK